MNRQYNDQTNKHKKTINVLRNLTQKTINRTWDEQTIQWPKKKNKKTINDLRNLTQKTINRTWDEQTMQWPKEQAQKDNKWSTKTYTENYKSNMRWTDNTMIKRKSTKRQ